MKRRVLLILMLALLCALLFAGCAPQAAPAAGLTVTDMLGREVAVRETRTIVSLAPSATEILYALGVGDRVAGVDVYSNYPEAAANAEVVGDFNGPDVEKIVALEPDIIFCGNTLQAEQISELENLGLPVVATEAVAFEDIPKSIAMMGEILGRQDEAQAVVDSISEAIDEARASAPEKAPTVYYAMSFGDMGNWTSGPGSFINTMIEIAGGVPVTKDAQAAWLEYPIEQLVSADPDIILVSSDMGSTDDISKAQGYSGLTAVKEGRVYLMQADILSRPGPRIADALRAISGALRQ